MSLGIRARNHLLTEKSLGPGSPGRPKITMLTPIINVTLLCGRPRRALIDVALLASLAPLGGPEATCSGCLTCPLAPANFPPRGRGPGGGGKWERWGNGCLPQCRLCLRQTCGCHGSMLTPTPQVCLTPGKEESHCFCPAQDIRAFLADP